MHEVPTTIIDALRNIPVLQILKIFSPTIIYYTGTIAKNNFILNHTFTTKDISKVTIPPELNQKFDTVQIRDDLSDKIKNAMQEFADVLIEKFPAEYLVNFYNNINTVDVIKKYKIIFNALGRYSVEDNRITLILSNSIYHELFHMASSVVDPKTGISYGGFQQRLKGEYNIGTALDEGYTEILAHRYFDDKHSIPMTYSYEVHVMKHIEKIVGQDKMEKMYLSADLDGLINELKRYATDEEVTNFISSFDFLVRKRTYFILLKHHNLQKATEIVGEFLFKTYLKKLKYQYDTGIIDGTTFYNEFNEYFHSLGLSTRFNFRSYKFLSEKRVQEIMEECLGSIPPLSEVGNSVKR